MRVVMVSKALVVGAYQRKAEALAQLGVDLTVLIPPGWRDSRGTQLAQALFTAGYNLRVIPLHFNGSFHFHYYPTLTRELRTLRPTLLHMDEEPYNLATWLALRAAASLAIPATFFTWQNLARRYPPPFRWMERADYGYARLAIAGSHEAAGVLRQKGYAGEIAVIPQFGVDPAVFRPAELPPREGRPLQLGYAGGLLPEKGVDLLLNACARLVPPWQLTIVGEGEQQPALEQLAQQLGIAGQVRFAGRWPSEQMPAFYQQLDVLVLPSRTRPNWKEQFGRVLVEAMACQVAVVGSSCGEIPQVIGDAGLVFAEDDAQALGGHLSALQAQPELRRHLGARGRARVLAHFTMDQIAAATVAAYARLLALHQGTR